ncbi:MAG: NADH-quinone oxidoreductase subunit A [Actinomycetota bacterium]|jgi:NADH-quinone oxidoreductase subunit A
MGQYLPIVAMIVLAGLFAALSFVASSLLQPRRPNPIKVSPYECGIVDQTEPPERFPVRFFLIAMIFIVFDIEIIFFYPFTMVVDQLGGYGLAAIGIFAVAVFESFLYLIRNGALEWGPVVRARRTQLRSQVDRTSASTIRRVGSEGRPVSTEVAA